MRLSTFEIQTPIGRRIRLGAALDIDGGQIVDLTAGFAAYLGRETDEPTPRELAHLRLPPDMIGWLKAGHEGFTTARRAIDYVTANPSATGLDGERLIYDQADIRLLSPLPRPTSFRDFSIYEEHMSRVEPDPSQTGARLDIRTPFWYTNPPYYKGNCASIGGPADPIPWPYYSKRLDPELEIGIIIGKGGRNLTVEQAKSHIAGYTLLVDSSSRDGFQREPFGPTKRKDFHTALGPFLTTPDEAGDVENLAIRIAVDGETWFEGSTAAPHSFRPEQLVAYASDSEMLEPGDLIGTGTIGASCSMDTHRWVQPGQRMHFWIERLGSLDLEIIEQEPVVRHVEGMDGLLRYRAPGA